MSTFYNLPVLGDKVTLLTHFVVREAQISTALASAGEREAFRQLIKISAWPAHRTQRAERHERGRHRAGRDHAGRGPARQGTRHWQEDRRAAAAGAQGQIWPRLGSASTARPATRKPTSSRALVALGYSDRKPRRRQGPAPGCGRERGHQARAEVTGEVNEHPDRRLRNAAAPAWCRPRPRRPMRRRLSVRCGPLFDEYVGPGQDARAAGNLHRRCPQARRGADHVLLFWPAGPGQDHAFPHHCARAGREPAPDQRPGAGKPKDPPRCC